MAQDRNELFAGYLAEVQTYIPFIYQRLDELQERSDNLESFSEIYRMVHIIKGASSMVGVQGLGRIAGYVEEVLEGIQEQGAPLSCEAIEALRSTVGIFERYSQALQKGETLDDDLLYSQTVELLGDFSASQDDQLFPMGIDDLLEEDELLSSDLEDFATESLLEEFQLEAGEHVTKLQQAVATFSGQSSPQEIMDALAPGGPVYASIHTIKGASSVFGLSRIANYATSLDEIFQSLSISGSQLGFEQNAHLRTCIQSLCLLIKKPEEYVDELAQDGLAQLRLFLTQAGQALPADAFGSVEEELGEMDTLEALLFEEEPLTVASAFSDHELQELQDGFFEEAREHLDLIGRSMAAIEQMVPVAAPLTKVIREEIRQIRRGVHTLKGSAAVVGVQNIADYAREVEHFLDWLFEEAETLSPEMLSVLGTALAVLANLATEPEAVVKAEQVEALRQLAVLMESSPGVIEENVTPASDESCGRADALSGSLADVLGLEEEFLEPQLAVDELLADGGVDLLENELPEPVSPLPGVDSTSHFSDHELQELQDGFVEEAQEHLTELQASFDQLELTVVAPVAMNDWHRENIRVIRRGVHTIKGASSVVGFQDIAHYAHGVEDCLDWMFEEADYLAPVILIPLGEALNLLGVLIDAPQSVSEPRRRDALQRLVEMMASEPPHLPEQGQAQENMLKDGLEDLVDEFEEIDLPFENDPHQTEIVAPPATVMESSSPQAPSVTGSTSHFSDEELLLLQQGFYEEAQEHLSELQQSLEHLEQSITASSRISAELREEIRTIRRCVHTIKGASAVVGMQHIAGYAHKVEDCLDWLFETAVSLDPSMLSTLGQALNLLGMLVDAPESVTAARREEVLQSLSEMAATPAPADPVQETEGAAPLPDAIVPQESAAAFALEDPASQLAAFETFAQTSPSFLEKQSPLVPVQGATSAAAPSLPDSTQHFSDEELRLLQDGFYEEAEEHLGQLQQSLEILEEGVLVSGPISAEHREEIRTIRRSVHTIKGASAVIGFQRIASYAHGVEDCLDWLYEEADILDPQIIASLAQGLNLLATLVEEPEKVAEERAAAMLRKLDGLSLALDQDALEEEAPAPAEPKQTFVPPMEEPVVQSTPSAEKVEAQGKLVAVTGELSKSIRINQGQLDTLINLTNELLVGVSGFDQDMELFNGALAELDLTTRRLKDIALELETKFEVKALDQLSERFTHLNETFSQLQSRQSFAEFDALELDRYTQLNLIIRSLNESAIDVSAIHGNLSSVYSGISGDISRQYRVIRELQVNMMRARMSPMATLSARLNRTVRDVASRLGKSVRLVMQGDRVELDRTVWEKLADPLMHLARNAVHHGIESKEQRSAQNKAAVATITLSAQREGNYVVLRFGDDGQGLDFNAIREKARQFGLSEKVSQMDERQLADLIYYPGFSTKTISEISGRGVGMDVVRESVRELQGAITTETRRGEGTTFVLRIPLTLGIVRALMVNISGITYGVPLNDIVDIQRLALHDIDKDRQRCTLSGKRVDLFSLPGLLGLHSEESLESAPLVLSLKAEGRRVALTIPQIAGQKEIVVKGLGSHLKTVPGVSGAAVMGDGSIVPVLDVADLIQAQEQAGLAHSTFAQSPPVQERTKTILIVDDSISIRRVMSRLVSINGWNPVEAKDGQDALRQLEAMTERPDCILLDIEMPNMNGFEFLAKLPNITEAERIPVVMLTSRTSTKHKEKAFQLGAKAFLNKPCKDEEFVDTVLRLTENATNDEVAI